MREISFLITLLFIITPFQSLRSEIIIMSKCDDKQDEFLKNEYILNLDELIMTRNYVYKEKTYQKYKKIIDPHTAVGLASSLKCSDAYDLKITLATAHPAKFKDTVSGILNNDLFITDKVKSIMNMKEDMIILDNDVTIVKEFLMDNIK